jgi:hypothetical protein
MGRECSTDARDERCIHYNCKTRMEEAAIKIWGIDERIILKCILIGYIGLT